MEQAAQRFRYLYETYLTEENSVFFSVIPDKNCFLAEESGHLSMDYDAFEKTMAENSRELILFRDSFGSSIAPLLLDGYSKITLVDTRYIHPDLLGKFVDFRGCDVLFLYSILVLNTFSF